MKYCRFQLVSISVNYVVLDYVIGSEPLVLWGSAQRYRFLIGRPVRLFAASPSPQPQPPARSVQTAPRRGGLRICLSGSLRRSRRLCRDRPLPLNWTGLDWTGLFPSEGRSHPSPHGRGEYFIL